MSDEVLEQRLLPKRRLSSAHACGLVTLSSLCVLMMGGLVFGFSSIFPVLYTERVFVDSCGAEAARACRAEGATTSKCCNRQFEQYSLMSSAALFAADGVFVFYGEAMDRLGPRACFFAGGLLCALGFLALGFNVHLRADPLWYLGFVSLGVAGPGIFISCLSLGQKHPRIEPLVTAFAASMFDSSAVIFLLFNAVYLQLGVSLDRIAFGWLGLCLLAGCATWPAIPTRRCLRAAEAAADTTKDTPADADAAPVVADAAEGAPAPSLRTLLLLPETLTMLGFMAVYNLKCSLYIETFSDQSRQWFDETSASTLDLLFNVAFPVGGLVTSGFASLLLHRYGQRPEVYMAVVFVGANLFGILQLLPYVPTQVLASLVFGAARTLQWACYFHFLTSPDRYPPSVSGRMLGYGNLAIALVGDVSPYALVSYVDRGPWPRTRRLRYTLVHAVLELGVLVCCALFPRALRRGRRKTRADDGAQPLRADDAVVNASQQPAAARAAGAQGAS